MNEKEAFIKQFREINPKFSRFYACFLTHTNLTMSQYVLLNHLTNSGRVPMTELSSKLHISKPAVTHLVDQLEKKKYTKRIAHAKDRRISLIEAQPKGQKIIRDMQSYILSYLLRTFDKFSSTEKKTIREFYTELSNTMDEVLAGGRKK